MSYVSRRNWKNSSSGFSYTNKGSKRVRKIILFIFFLFILYEVVSALFLVSYRVESISMEPTIPSSAVVLASPLIYGPEVPFTSVRIPGIRKPNRGDIVVCSPAFQQPVTWYLKTVDAIISFFTLQKRGIVQERNWVNSLVVKRVAGVPGDTVKMDNYELLIKPNGKNYFFSERDIMQVEYSTDHYSKPELLPEDFPLSGNMDEVTLGPGEYFLIGDNRSMSNDSYYWGAVDINNIHAKVLFEYAPEIKLLQ